MSKPPFHLKQGHMELFAQDHVQMVSGCLQGRKLHMPFQGNLCQCLFTFTVKYFLIFRWNLLWFSLCPLPLVPSVGSGLALTSLHPPFRYLHVLMTSSRDFPSPGCIVPDLSAFTHRQDAPVPYSS